MQVDAGNPFVIRDGDQMDAFLNDVMDLNTDLKPDEILDNFVGLLNPYCDY